jgi:trehalose/maltose hydrolase-like predicted phosphorylase
MTDTLVFDNYDPADEPRRQTLMGLGNGRIFARACAPGLAADDPAHGIRHAGLYETVTVQADRPFSTERTVPLPAWPAVRLRIDGGPWFSLDAVRLDAYEHRLDTRRGIAARHMLFEDAAGRRSELLEERLISMARPEIAALRLTLTAHDWTGAVEVGCSFDAPGQAHADLVLIEGSAAGGAPVAVAFRTTVPAGPCHRAAQGDRRHASEHWTGSLRPGERLVLERTTALVVGRDPAVRDVFERACAAVRDAPAFDALADDHAAAWSGLWRQASLDVADATMAQAVQLHAFHLLQAFSPHSVPLDAGFPARGWHDAYDGQIFWDDVFLFPYFVLRFPALARALLIYRHRRLPAARIAAKREGLGGAMFPWRSASTGDEVTPRRQFNPVSGRWMSDDTRLERHIGSAIALNLWRYFEVTQDVEFLGDYGAELLIEIARFWASLARYDPLTDRYDIDGVIGPDEFHSIYPGATAPGLRNNAYTNAMAAWTMLRAAEVLLFLPAWRREALADALAVDEAEIASWRRIAGRTRLVFVDGILSQFEGIDALLPFDGATYASAEPDGRIDYLLEARDDDVNRYLVMKQPDVLMLFYLFPGNALTALLKQLGYDFDLAAMQRTAAHYLGHIVHESSLSRVVCAGAMAALDCDRSWDFFQEAMHVDLLADPHSGTDKGLHLGAMAGTFDVVQRHYLGLDFEEGAILLQPNAPAGLPAIGFPFRYRGQSYSLSYDRGRVTLAAAAENEAAVRVVRRDGEAELHPGTMMMVDAVATKQSERGTASLSTC